MKNAIYLFLFCSVVAAGIQSCENTSIEFEGFSSEQVGFILSADSNKTWQRQSLLIDGQMQEISGCQENVQIKFQEETPENDNLVTYRVVPVNGCTEEIIFSGSWQVVAGPAVDTLYLQNNDTLLTRYISDLTSQRLEYFYQENAVRITEIFSALN